MATLGSSGQDGGTTATTTTGTASSSNNPPVDNAGANICNNNSILSGGIGALSLFHPNQYAAMSFLGSNGNFAATVGANANINNANANNHSAQGDGGFFQVGCHVHAPAEELTRNGNRVPA